MKGIEFLEDFPFGALLGLWDGFQGEGDSARGEVVARFPIFIGGEEDGIGESELEGAAFAGALVEFVAGSGGDTGKGVLNSGGQVSDVIVDEDAIGVGSPEDLGCGVGMRSEGAGVRVEEGAQDFGGGGFAGGGGAVEDEDGVGISGAERGEEPGVELSGLLRGEAEQRLERRRLG